MTAITLSAPRRVGRSTGAVRPVAPARPARPTASRPVAARTPVRLTRRGRLALTGLFATTGVAVTLFTGSVSFAGTQVERPAVRQVTVAPGQTLWSIAGQVAPDDDRRDTVARILELNALDDSGVRSGQQIAVPVG